MKRCAQCRRGFREFLYLVAGWLAWLPCTLTERWFFWQVGGWRQRVGNYFVSWYYWGSRHWPSANERKWCSCQRMPRPTGSVFLLALLLFDAVPDARARWERAIRLDRHAALQVLSEMTETDDVWALIKSPAAVATARLKKLIPGLR